MFVLIKKTVESRALQRLVAALAILPFGLSHCAAIGQSVNYFTSLPEIQMYSYPSSTANGAGSVRDRGPTFAHFSATVGGQPTFVPGDGLTPSRRGSILLAVDTSESIPVVEPSRYQIDSVRIKIVLLGSLIYPEYDFLLHYDNTLDSALSLTTGGNDDLGHPVEMYGIGFQSGFNRFGFTPEQTGSQYFRLGEERWPSTDLQAPYRYYSVDAEGRDVENSVFGGYSATAPNSQTAQFTPTPFAIGRVYDAQSGLEFAPGALLNLGDVFEFEADLTAPGVVSYIQQSLSLGQLGFGLSSMHPTESREGSATYPDFYLDDLDIGPNEDADGPTFEINVTILPEKDPGDYDSDGGVDGADFLAWQREFGALDVPIGWGADGDKNGQVAAGDLQVWRNHFGSGNSFVAGAATPEPGAYALAAIASLGWLAISRRPRPERRS